MKLLANNGRIAPIAVCALLASCLAPAILVAERPNIVLVMADDQGWGEVGYRGHPVLKTPHLDAMAEAGLRMDRFYAGAPVCSPTRASVLTGRSNNRTGVQSHGYALRRQEKTIAEALRGVGYRTGHFGKWHLNGLRGAGVPVLASDNHHPGHFGFDQWLSVTNFFDRNPLLSRQGTFEEFQGDSSEIAIEQALKFIHANVQTQTPTFTVVWFGTPHSPFEATEEDMVPFAELDRNSRQHYGELVALDRSIGTLRSALREMGIEKNTLVWYCSDNGGLPKIAPETVGGLRGFKGSLYEGGLRVPGIIEWSGTIQPRISLFPASVLDIFPTVAEIVGLPSARWVTPQDGLSLRQVFSQEPSQRDKPIPFNYMGQTAMVDNNWKIVRLNPKDASDSSPEFEIYDLSRDPTESHNVVKEVPEVAGSLQRQLLEWEHSLERSVAGQDYPEKQVDPNEPVPRFWVDVDEYQPYLNSWKNRPEYQSTIDRATK